MNRLIAALLLLVGLVHVLPVSGVLGAESLQRLYGVSVDEANLQILLRHRALLFAMLGAFLIAAAFKPSLRPPALAAGLISTASFIALAESVGAYNAWIQRVVMIDWAALAALLLALVLNVINGRHT